MLRKHYLFIFLSSIFAITSINAQNLFMPEHLTIQKVKESQVEVAWNFYNVLAVREHSRKFLYTKSCLAHPAITASMASRLAYATLTGKENSIRKALEQMNTVLPKYSSGEGFVQWFNQCGEPGLAIIGQEVALALKPTGALIFTTHKLNNNHITQRLASNIGPKMLQLSIERMEQRYKVTLPAYVTVGKAVDYSAFGPDKTQPLNAAQLTTHIQPDGSFYADYNTTYNPLNDKIIVYIGDNREMLEAAQQAGWVGIYYDATNPECNVEQLENTLASLGLLS